MTFTNFSNAASASRASALLVIFFVFSCAFWLCVVSSKWRKKFQTQKFKIKKTSPLWNHYLCIIVRCGCASSLQGGKRYLKNKKSKKENLSIMKPLFMHYCALWLCVVSSRREKIFEKQKIKKRKPLHYDYVIRGIFCVFVLCCRFIFCVFVLCCRF